MPRIRHLERIRLFNLWCEANEAETKVPSLRRRLLLVKSSGEISQAEFQQLVNINTHELVELFFVILTGKRVVYISEVVNRQALPEFAPISWPTLPLAMANSAKITVGVYCRVPGKSWQFLVQVKLDLGALVYTGPPLEDIFRTNAVALLLDGNWYSVPPFLKAVTLPKPATPREPPIKSYNFDNIRSLFNLAQSLRELLAQKHATSNDITRQICDYPLPLPTESIEAKKSWIDDDISSVSSSINKDKARILGCQMKINQIRQSRLAKQAQPLEPVDDTDIMALADLQVNQEVAGQLLVVEDVWPTTAESIGYLPFPSSYTGLLNICYYDGDLVTLAQSDSQGAALHWQDKINQINAGLTIIAQWVNCFCLLIEITPIYCIEFDDKHWYIVDRVSPEITKYPFYYDELDTAPIDKFSNKLTNANFEHALVLMLKNLAWLVKQVTGQKLPEQSRDNMVWIIHYLTLYQIGKGS